MEQRKYSGLQVGVISLVVCCIGFLAGWAVGITRPTPKGTPEKEIVPPSTVLKSSEPSSTTDNKVAQTKDSLATSTDNNKNVPLPAPKIVAEKTTLPSVRRDFDATIPHPQATAQKYLQPEKGKPKEPEKAISEMQVWFDANRDSDAYGAALDFAYARMAWAYRESTEPDKAEAFLQNEMKLTQNPKALYSIHAELAQFLAARKQWEQAEQTWLEARRVMLDGQHPYFTTRQALPYLEVGKMYKTAGNAAKAIQYFELYQNTSYGKTEENGLCEQLSELYAAQGEWAKVVALCQNYIDAYGRARFANEKYKQDLIAKFRTRLEEAKKKLADSPQH